MQMKRHCSCEIEPGSNFFCLLKFHDSNIARSLDETSYIAAVTPKMILDQLWLNFFYVATASESEVA